MISIEFLLIDRADPGKLENVYESSDNYNSAVNNLQMHGLRTLRSDVEVDLSEMRLAEEVEVEIHSEVVVPLATDPDCFLKLRFSFSELQPEMDDGELTRICADVIDKLDSAQQTYGGHGLKVLGVQALKTL